MSKRVVLVLGIVLALAAMAVAFRKPLKRWYRVYTTEVSTGRFQDPEGLAVDSMGNIYVADEDWQRFTMLDSDGNTLASFETVPGYPGRITTVRHHPDRLHQLATYPDDGHV